MQKRVISRRLLIQGTVGVAVAAKVTNVALAQPASPSPSAATPVAETGHLTAERPYLVATDPATLQIVPLISAGEMVAEYQMAGVPDGLGAYLDGDRAVVFMNHELSPDDDSLSSSRVSRLELDPETGAVLSASYVIDGTEGYWSLCSASLAGPEVGFANPVFLTGEETADGPFNGLALAIDAVSGEVTQLPWLGHFAHENQVVIPGFEGKTVVVATDDDSSGSELYMYVADSPEGVLDGSGQLYVFVADDAQNTGDLAKGAELTGTFVPVDQADNVDAATLQATAESAGAFAFVRLEDVTYDRTTPSTIYFADTGDDEEPNLDATGKPYTLNGRIYRMELDPTDPTKVNSLSVLLDGDAGDDIRNPDNLDASATTIMITEDLNGYNRQENSEETARVLAYDIASGTLTTIARLDQSDGDGLVDAGDLAGSWESSGVLNTADIFGEGTWLIDVQAHSLQVDQFGGTDEGGQLLLLRQV